MAHVPHGQQSITVPDPTSATMQANNNSLPCHEFSNLPIDLELSASHFASIEVAAGTAQVRWNRRGVHREIELADCRSVNHLYGTHTNPTSCSCASGCDRFYSEDDSVRLHAGL